MKGLHSPNEGCGEWKGRREYVSGATEKQGEVGRRYEGAVNACRTDDQPGNVPLP